MWREKLIKIAYWSIAFNALISIGQAFFVYSHYIKHEWWTMGLSLFFVLFNGYIACWQFKNLRRIQQELKDLVWSTLQTPSEALR